MITVARFTPLLDTASGMSLTAFFLVALGASGVVAVIPLVVWLTDRRIDRWVDEDAPRPRKSGPT